MDPTHYEKIADKLMQFRGKIPKDATIMDPTSQMILDELKYKIDTLLKSIDYVSELDEAGWIR